MLNATFSPTYLILFSRDAILPTAYPPHDTDGQNIAAQNRVEFSRTCAELRG